MSKGTTIISDLRSFFSENENNRAINAIMSVMECINIRPDQIGTEKKENCKFTNMQVLNLLVLFPFFVVRNVYRYSGSSLSRLFCCEKGMFYRFSHLEHKTILGYKCLTLLLSDGMSQLFLDFSLHGEEGRKPDKKQGLTDKQRSERFSADYAGQSVEERIKEYTMKKNDCSTSADVRAYTSLHRLPASR